MVYEKGMGESPTHPLVSVSVFGRLDGHPISLARESHLYTGVPQGFDIEYFLDVIVLDLDILLVILHVATIAEVIRIGGEGNVIDPFKTWRHNNLDIRARQEIFLWERAGFGRRIVIQIGSNQLHEECAVVCRRDIYLTTPLKGVVIHSGIESLEFSKDSCCSFRCGHLNTVSLEHLDKSVNPLEVGIGG